jgi:hypothetical protein
VVAAFRVFRTPDSILAHLFISIRTVSTSSNLLVDEENRRFSDSYSAAVLGAIGEHLLASAGRYSAGRFSLH